MKRVNLMLPLVLLVIICLVAPVFGQELPVKVQRKKTEPRVVGFIRHQGPFTDMPRVIDMLYAELEKGGYNICGPLMAVFYDDPGETPESELRWDVRIPVANPGSLGKPEDDILGFGYQDVAYVAYTYHVGPKEKIADSYNTLIDWQKTTKHDVSGYFTEVYWSRPDAEKQVIEIWLPVREKTASERGIKK